MVKAKVRNDPSWWEFFQVDRSGRSLDSWRFTVSVESISGQGLVGAYNDAPVVAISRATPTSRRNGSRLGMEQIQAGRTVQNQESQPGSRAELCGELLHTRSLLRGQVTTQSSWFRCNSGSLKTPSSTTQLKLGFLSR